MARPAPAAALSAQRLLLCLANLPACLCLVVFGATVERPINSPAPVVMLVLAVVAAAAAATGLAGGGGRWRWLLTTHVVLQALLVLVQLILVGVVSTRFDDVVARIDPAEAGPYTRQRVVQVLSAAKWLLGACLVGEAGALVASALLRFLWEPPHGFTAGGFDAEGMQLKAGALAGMRGDMEAAAGGSGGSGSRGGLRGGRAAAMYGKVAGKLAKQYGRLAHGVSFKRGWLPW